jgi:hypothetical protein
MWPEYIILDNFLRQDHLDALKKIPFLTQPDEWEIIKNKVFPDGTIQTNWWSSVSRSEIPEIPKKEIFEIFQDHNQSMLDILNKLAPEKVKKYSYTELNIVMSGKNFVWPIHNDSRDKLLSVVVYISPEKNEGTWIYDNKAGVNSRSVDWKVNRAFVFSRNEKTWHSYKADGINNRLTLVYNLRT